MLHCTQHNAFSLTSLNFLSLVLQKCVQASMNIGLCPKKFTGPSMPGGPFSPPPPGGGLEPKTNQLLQKPVNHPRGSDTPWTTVWSGTNFKLWFFRNWKFDHHQHKQLLHEKNKVRKQYPSSPFLGAPWIMLWGAVGQQKGNTVIVQKNYPLGSTYTMIAQHYPHRENNSQTGQQP